MTRRPDVLALLLAGKSMARIAMLQALAGKAVRGKVIDVGGGRSPDYLPYLDMTGASPVEPVDARVSGIDFEKDPLPYEDASVDTVILANTLEHIYNHRFLVGECARVLKPGGTLIGFVPFFVGYHPDPEDYFRYTKTALERILGEHLGDVSVEEAGGGPYIANFNTICLSIPRILRPLTYLWYEAIDSLFLAARPHARARTPLGYAFTARRHA